MPRIRLQSCAPLPDLKAWFLVPNNVANIRDLKLSLCSQLSALKDAHLQPGQLALEMDDFEILDESSVDLVREADVIILKKREVTKVPYSLKRKFDAENLIPIETKRRKLTNKPVPSVSTSSGTSSSSDSDSDTSSSSSSIGTDSDSSLSSDSAPSVATTNIQPLTKPPTPTMANRNTMRSALSTDVQQFSVPPGCGKPSTQARNRRRKIKRKFAAGQGIPGSPSASTPIRNPSDDKKDETIQDLPYDDPAPESARMSLTATTALTSLSSLGNRNKRKGFKKSMEGVQPRKLVFDSTTAPSFVPPSEREVLPHNIIVTSVDVEWRTGRGRWQDGDEAKDESVPETKVLQLTHGEPEFRGGIDWTAAEAGWTKYPRIEATTNILVGGIVAWRGFGIDPVTLTPQASLLHLGKVVALDAETLTVSSLVRPDAGHATFGRAQVNDEVEEEPAEQISTALTEIWSNDWRVVSNQ